jgi:hypothetical protein
VPEYNCVTYGIQGNLVYECMLYLAATFETGDVTLYSAALALDVFLLSRLAHQTPVVDAANGALAHHSKAVGKLSVAAEDDAAQTHARDQILDTDIPCARRFVQIVHVFSRRMSICQGRGMRYQPAKQWILLFRHQICWGSESEIQRGKRARRRAKRLLFQIS